MVQRKKLPAYDERLRGYFENKAVHCRHLATLGYGWPRRTAKSLSPIAAGLMHPACLASALSAGH